MVDKLRREELLQHLRGHPHYLHDVTLLEIIRDSETDSIIETLEELDQYEHQMDTHLETLKR